MEVYIEYAFLQNFLFDGALLFLALKGAKVEIQWKLLLLSAALGALFALLFPLFAFNDVLSLLLKLVAGLLICLIPSRLKTKKQRGRYALTVCFFFIFSFGFGGALLAVLQSAEERTSPFLVLLGFLLLSCFSLVFVEKMYKKRAIHAFLYDCVLINGETEVKAQGFLDSGNLATKKGVPVCFLSPDLFYDLIGQQMFFEKEAGQVRDEMCVQTIVGVEVLPLYKGEISIKKGRESIRKEVYFALSKNSISKEYALLLNARIFE